MTTIKLLEEVLPGRRLGRHVEHDVRSRGYAAPVAPITSACWTRRCAVLDQGDLGACTGYAMAGVIATDSAAGEGRELLEADAAELALRLYKGATRIDRIPGHYPPADTGSTGLAVAKAAARKGLIKGYRHAFGLVQALGALSRGPVLAGVNWYEGFDEPIGDAAELRISGRIRGGHEVELLEVNVEKRFVRGVTSWGESFGNLGYFVWTFDTFDRLLREDGDVIEPLR